MASPPDPGSQTLGGEEHSESLKMASWGFDSMGARGVDGDGSRVDKMFTLTSLRNTPEIQGTFFTVKT